MLHSCVGLVVTCLVGFALPCVADGGPRYGLDIAYEAMGGREPSDLPELGFASSALGRAEFTEGDAPRLRTFDTDEQADGRYYFRPLTRRQVDERSDVMLEVAVRVLSSVGPAVSTCVQISLRDRRVGLGFLTNGAGPDDDEVLLLDLGASGHGEVIGRLRLGADVMRRYTLRTDRGGDGTEDDSVVFEVAGMPGPPLRRRIADLSRDTSHSYYGLIFGHPVGAGTGEAEWERLSLTITRDEEKTGPLAIGNRRQLLVDDYVIDRAGNLERVLGEPTRYPGNPTLRREYPWEAARCELYGSAVWDPDTRRVQLFYSAMSKPYEIMLAYADSDDLGAHWRKPLLGLAEFEGQPTNVVHPGRYQPHGPSVIRDGHDPDPTRRYKLFTADYPIPLTDEAQTNGKAGIDVAFSPDGIHWTPSARNPVLPGVISDTGQCVLWDPDLGKYVAFVRMWPGGQRSVGRTESADFESWSEPEVVYTPTAADRERSRQFYSLSATYYEGLYIGLVWVFPAVPESADWNADTPTTWPELVVSRDGFDWERVAFGRPFLPLGPPGSFDHRQIRTASSLVVLDDRILLLYAGSPHPHVSQHNFDIGVATLRLDGFAAMRAGQQEGTLLTTPLEIGAGELHINAATRPGGSVVAELCDANGEALPGYEAERCTPFAGDSLDALLTWGGTREIPASAAAGTRIRFRLRDADLYSFWVAPQ